MKRTRKLPTIKPPNFNKFSKCFLDRYVLSEFRCMLILCSICTLWRLWFLCQMNNTNHSNEHTSTYKKTSPYVENREREKEREKEANGEIDHSPKNLYQVCHVISLSHLWIEVVSSCIFGFSFSQLQRAYSQQCEELKLLRKQVLARDKRIHELEQQVAQLTATQTSHKDILPQRIRR